MKTLKERFDAVHDAEYGEFQRIPLKRSMRRDMHAFSLLDSLVKEVNPYKIVGAAGHDQIYLIGDPKDLNEVLTDDQVLELVRCGVFISEDSLSMFV